MNSILVTGATGMLGSSLVPFLKKSGYKVVTHALSSQADVTCDLSDKIKSYEILDQIQPTTIINLASLTNVELCEHEVNTAYLTNTRSVENIACWIASRGVGCHLIQISTDHVYDGKGPHKEQDICIQNTYAFSKYSGELAAVRVPSSVLRTNFVGRSNVSHRKSFTDWIHSSITGNQQVQLLSDVYFSPLSIKLLLDMINLVVKNKPVGIFNLGSHNGMSKADFAFAFVECLKLPTKTVARITSNEAKFLKTYRPKDMRMNCLKFEDVLKVNLPNLSELIEQVSKEYYEIT